MKRSGEGRYCAAPGAGLEVRPMDAEQRKLVVIDRMAELKQIHLPLARPCSDCRFGPLDGAGRGICEHYANWQIVGDPATGKRTGSVHVSTMTARSAEGLCGPEGLLFEGRSKGQKVALWLSRANEFQLMLVGLLVLFPLAALVVGLWIRFLR